jgi:hypothetical protein
LVKTLSASLAISAASASAEKIGHRFQDGHLGTEAPPDRTHLQADHPGPDHREPLGHRGKIERADVVAHDLVVDGDAGQMACTGTGRDDHLARTTSSPTFPPRSPFACRRSCHGH